MSTTEAEAGTPQAAAGTAAPAAGTAAPAAGTAAPAAGTAAPAVEAVEPAAETAAGAARPLRRDAERNRLRILRAAAEVFTEQGLRATLDDVADRAGVGVGTVYRRFPDKEALVEALFTERPDTHATGGLQGGGARAGCRGTACRSVPHRYPAARVHAQCVRRIRAAGPPGDLAQVPGPHARRAAAGSRRYHGASRASAEPGGDGAGHARRLAQPRVRAPGTGIAPPPRG